MKKFRKILALVIVMIMLVSMIPMTSAGALSVYPEMSLNTMVEVKGDAEIHSYTFRPQQDGWYKFVSGGDCDTYITLYDKFLRVVGSSDDNSLDDQNFELVTELTAGELYYVKVSSWEEEDDSFFFDVEKAVVATSFEIISMPYDTTVIKDNEYYTAELDGIEIEFTLSDGTKMHWDLATDDKIGDDYVFTNSDFDENGEFFVEICCGDAYVKIPYTVVESDIESIEYSCDEELIFYENSNGYFDESLGYYVYSSYIPYGAVITVNYKDGSSEQCSFYGFLNDYEFFMEDSQDSQPWVAGGENYIYVTYLDAKTEVPVTILPCPIANVTVNSAPDKTYYYGDEKIGNFDYNDVYSFYPDDLSGLSFTVEYKDGTTKTYTDKDIDEYNGLIDDYMYEISEVQCKKAGVYTATISYKGYDFDFDVVVDNTPVKKIEFVKHADRTQYEDYYYPVLDGMQIKVTFKDGTSKTVDVTSENTSYIHEGDLGYIINADGVEISVSCAFDEQDNEYYKFNCLGFTQNYYGFDFTETRVPEYVLFENVSDNGDNMVVTITYEDGSVDTLNFDLVAYDQYDTYYDAFAMTENGGTYYSIEKFITDDGSECYEIFLLGDYYEVDIEENAPMIGDVDGDGEITILDATAIQLHIAKIKLLDESVFDIADVDADDELSVMDTTEIQRFIAKIITEFK